MQKEDSYDLKELNKKIQIVENILKDEVPLIAFSGGADSTLLAIIAKKVSKNPLAVTIDNNLMPKNFSLNAEKKAKEIGIDHITIEKDFYDNPDFIENTEKRCYICRKIMFGAIEELKNDKYTIIIDGNNLSDLFEDRPGIVATYKKGIVSPLIIAEIEKKDVLNYLEINKISFLTSTTCLATRIKTNEKINKYKINLIKNTEEELKKITNDSDLRLRIENGNKKLKAKLELSKPIGEIPDKEDFEEFEVIKKNKKVINKNRLPYKINLESSLKEINKKTANAELIKDDNPRIIVNETIINENGKIRYKNLKELKKVLTCIRRKI